MITSAARHDSLRRFGARQAPRVATNRGARSGSALDGHRDVLPIPLPRPLGEDPLYPVQDESELVMAERPNQDTSSVVAPGPRPFSQEGAGRHHAGRSEEHTS